LKQIRAFVFLTIGLAMTFFALPHLPDVTMSLEGAFTLSWLAFALLIVSANLYHLIGVDREQQANRRRSAWIRATMHQWNQGTIRPVQPGKAQGNRRRYMR
jgi:hypothetical protein